MVSNFGCDIAVKPNLDALLRFSPEERKRRYQELARGNTQGLGGGINLELRNSGEERRKSIHANSADEWHSLFMRMKVVN